MLKKSLLLALTLVMLLSSVALAETTNRDMQLMGGVVVSNASDSYFFAPMEEGMSNKWGLYALSKAAEGPIAQAEGYPARLIHASADKVYFLGYKDGARTLHDLYSVEISTGTYKELLTNIKSAFVYKDDEFYYVSNDDLFTLCSYNLSTETSTKIKDMSGSEKTIYDACYYDGNLYFSTKNKNESVEDAYIYNKDNGKANNLDKPSPAIVSGMMYEGYRVYAADAGSTQIYAMGFGSKKSTRIGANYNISLANPRFGQAMYGYDGENSELVRVPLDGSAETKLKLETGTLQRVVLGGTKDELLLVGNGAIYAIRPDLSSETKLFDFDSNTGGTAWTYVAPAGSNAVMVMGYNAETFTHSGNMMPTNVYAFDRATGEMLFGFPEYDAENPVEPQTPSTIGQQPVEEPEEGETLFKWND